MNSIDGVVNEIDYSVFLRIIKSIPSCIFFKDTQLRYRFCTQHWEQQNCANITGKTDLEIRKDKDNALLAEKTDKNIINTKKGCSYVVKSEIDGHTAYLELIKEPVFNELGDVIGIVGLINDVTDKTLLEQQLKELSTIDSLTTLLNRRRGTEIIEKRLEIKCTDSAFCIIDINKFKKINDSYGHHMGDNVLREFGYAIKQSIYDDDIAMRLGGDEFIVFLSGIKGKEQAEAFISKLYENINAIKVPGFTEQISASIGIKLIDDMYSFDRIYMITDSLMYEAKFQKDSNYIIK